MHNAQERAAIHGARSVRFHCPGLLPALLLMALALLGGCAAKQQAAPPAPSASVDQKMDVIEAARSNIGVPYRFGGRSPQTGFDCSGLVCWSYEQVGISLPRRASDQLRFGEKVEKKEDLQPGDIVVFKGTRGRTGWHSGIYAGNGKFVHSPRTGKTVTESNLSETYYAKRYAGARRIPRDGSAATLLAEFNTKGRTAAPAKSSRAATSVAGSQQSSKKAPTVASAKPAKEAPTVTSAKPAKEAPTVASAKPAKKAPTVAGSKPAKKAPMVAGAKPAKKATPSASSKSPQSPAASAAKDAPASAKSAVTAASAPDKNSGEPATMPSAKPQTKPEAKSPANVREAKTPLQTAAVDRSSKKQQQAAGVVSKLKAENKSASASSKSVAKGK